jgi:hypothetical protein
VDIIKTVCVSQQTTSDVDYLEKLADDMTDGDEVREIAGRMAKLDYELNQRPVSVIINTLPSFKTTWAEKVNEMAGMDEPVTVELRQDDGITYTLQGTMLISVDIPK